MKVLLCQGEIESVGMACSSDVGGGGALADHLQYGITRYEVNQQEDDRNHQPDYWQHVRETQAEVAKQGEFGNCVTW